MKDIKSYVIGFLSCVCMFLIMGQTKEMYVTTTDNGRYQISTVLNTGGIWETTIDTRTGEIFKRENVSFHKYLK